MQDTVNRPLAYEAVKTVAAVPDVNAVPLTPMSTDEPTLPNQGAERYESFAKRYMANAVAPRLPKHLGEYQAAVTDATTQELYAKLEYHQVFIIRYTTHGP